MGSRAAWSAAWGVVATMFGGGAAALWVALTTGGNWWFLLPAVVFSVIALIGLYCAFAVLGCWWPFSASGEASGGHAPPGGGMPLQPPVDYQAAALRQVIARVSETQDTLDYAAVHAVLKNLPRAGTDPIYEPLSAAMCREGLAKLTELGELEGPDDGGWWRIVKSGRKR